MGIKDVFKPSSKELEGLFVLDHHFTLYRYVKVFYSEEQREGGAQKDI